MVLVHNEVAGRQVGERLDAVTVRALDLGLFAACEHLPLSHDHQTEIRIFKAGGDHALHDVDAAALREKVAQLHLEAAVGQRVEHIFTAQRAAADDRDRASLLSIAADVGGRHVQIAAVGIHLVGDEIFEMLRRKLGNAVQKAVHADDLPLYAANPGEIQRVAVHAARQLAALHERRYIVRDTGMKIPRGVAQARRILDEDERVLRQIVERRRHLRIDERQILVRRRERSALAQALRVAFQIFLKFGVLFFSAARGKRCDRLRQSCRAALRERRQRLHARQTAQRFTLLQTALAADVECGDRVDLIVPELHAVRMLGLRRKNIQNAAAHGKLTHALDL